MKQRSIRSLAAATVASVLLALLVGCRDEESTDGGGGTAPGDPKPGAGDVVVYSSVDEPYARPILEVFTRQTGIKVSLQSDTERNKSVGLAARLEAERDNPRADVWWGNEVFHTINLADAGVLAPYESPAATDIPALFKDPEHRWAGAGLRARVIARTTVTGDGAADAVAHMRSLRDLLDPNLKGRIAMAHPSAGTTTGHVASLYVLWGPDRAREFLRGLRANDVKLLGGNSVVAEKAADGTVWAGLTDNDDVESAKRQGGAIEMVLPDQDGDGDGTLTIPTTVALVKGAPHAEAARRLIDFLLSAEVERQLIEAKFARYSVRRRATSNESGTSDDTIKPMNVDYREVAKVLKQAAREATEILEGRSAR